MLDSVCARETGRAWSRPVSEVIPFERLGIPAPLQARLTPEAPPGPKLPIARGLLPVPPDVLLGLCYVLSMDPDPGVADAARATLTGLPLKQLNIAITEKTHPKILEFLAEFRAEEPDLDLRLLRLRATNTRAARVIAARSSEGMCEEITRNHERLLLSPEMVFELHANPSCTDAQLERALSFLALEGLPQQVPTGRPFRDAGPAAAPAAPAADTLAIDPEEEVEAALRGDPSPALVRRNGRRGAGAFGDRDTSRRTIGAFEWDFQDEDEFDALLLGDDDDRIASVDEKKTIVQIIAAMSVAQKLKLAYLGNKESRAILIRDRVKSVPVAVIRSGRVSDGEAVAFAADRNLPRDVIREIAMSKEYIRKYTVKVALANNPKTPLSVAMGFLKDLYKKDLQNLARNKGVPSVLSGAAFKLARAKDT